jgi:hypothetical protein
MIKPLAMALNLRRQGLHSSFQGALGQKLSAAGILIVAFGNRC